MAYQRQPQQPTNSTASTAKGTEEKKQKRSGGCSGFLFFLILIIVGAVALGGIGLLAPVRLALAHEQVLGLLHGGIASSEEIPSVDCVRLDGYDEPQALSRVRRVITFNDGTSLEIIFIEKPQSTNLQC